MDGPTILDARAKPPARIRDVFKRCQKTQCDEDISGDFTLLAELDDTKDMPVRMSHAVVQRHLEEFCDGFELEGRLSHLSAGIDVEVYECKTIPGLYYLPNLLSPCSQVALLEKMFKRDLLNQVHQTNVHMHYNIQHPPQADNSSFFDLDRTMSFSPKDPSCHKPLSITQFLEKKLRWMTLGGQYDWTRKVYPTGGPPPFPADIKQLLEGVFDMKAEAAIVNLYSPGDTLSVHRDVSEFCDRPLISVSIGCECTFVIGLASDDNEDSDSRVVSMQLRSGDAVVMSRHSRFAWHGVPKVFANTCPEWLMDWPGDQSPQWKGWMSRKRINLNVRQMFE